MSYLITLTNGETIDLDTSEGQYSYVGQFLGEHTASSEVWSALGSLYAKAISRESTIAKNATTEIQFNEGTNEYICSSCGQVVAKIFIDDWELVRSEIEKSLKKRMKKENVQA